MTTTTGPEATPKPRRNPYRGPREFRRGDELPNRRRQTRDLTNRLVAERIVLLHSPSGAGKTSLMEAGVVARLLKEGFQPTPRLRVNEPVNVERSVPVRNRYIHSLVSYLLADPKCPERPDDLPLCEAIDRWRELQGFTDKSIVLIIDQLEEILTLDPTDWDAKEDFFFELGALLNEHPIWALLSMREDYIGGLDRYLRFLPGLLRARYRLDFLTKVDARLAMQVPAKQQLVTFTDAAAEELINRLAVVQVQRPGEAPITKDAPYVEPFQLQVVCRGLWKKTSEEHGDGFETIEVADVEKHADIDQAMAQYFATTVANVVRRTGADERRIREWFEVCLITEQRFRSQTLSAPDTIDAQTVRKLLEDGFLIRGEVRGASTWYELAHDRLISPVLASNDTWRQQNL
jgi:hypothetical protein